MLKRAWRIIRISLLVILALVLAAAGLAAFWAYRAMQPRDIWSARQRWPTAMTFEAADRAALDLVSKMPLDKSRLKTLAVVGHLADAANTGDHGSSYVNPPVRHIGLEGAA